MPEGISASLQLREKGKVLWKQWRSWVLKTEKSKGNTETLYFKNMFFPHKIKKLIGKGCLLGLTLLSMASCSDSFIFEDEGDCSLHYKLKFCYDMNLKWANAFASEVKSVRVYIFDEEGSLVKILTEFGDELKEPDFDIDLDLPKGNYHLVAWCGIDNPGVEQQSFYAPREADLTLQDLYCRLNYKTDHEYSAYSDQHLQFMFYGNLDVEIEEENDTGGIIYYTMPLVKDTNHIRIELVQLSGNPVNVKDFTFTIDDADGEMNYANSLVGDRVISYIPWHLENADVELGETRSLIHTQSAVADIDVSRMTVGHKKQMRLTIRNSGTGDVIASVPIIDYALLAKDYYEMAYEHKMTDQEFLDREDEYSMTFFLDEDLKWINSFIYINSWRIVPHEYGLN